MAETIYEELVQSLSDKDYDETMEHLTGRYVLTLLELPDKKLVFLIEKILASGLPGFICSIFSPQWIVWETETIWPVPIDLKERFTQILKTKGIDADSDEPQDGSDWIGNRFMKSVMEGGWKEESQLAEIIRQLGMIIGYENRMGNGWTEPYTSANESTRRIILKDRLLALVNQKFQVGKQTDSQDKVVMSPLKYALFPPKTEGGESSPLWGTARMLLSQEADTSVPVDKERTLLDCIVCHPQRPHISYEEYQDILRTAFETEVHVGRRASGSGSELELKFVRWREVIFKWFPNLKHSSTTGNRLMRETVPDSTAEVLEKFLVQMEEFELSGDWVFAPSDPECVDPDQSESED